MDAKAGMYHSNDNAKKSLAIRIFSINIKVKKKEIEHDLLRNDYAILMTPRYDAQIVLIVKVNSFAGIRNNNRGKTRRGVTMFPPLK